MSTLIPASSSESLRSPLFHWEIKGRFRKRVVLANVPSFRFSFLWEHPPKPPFWKPPSCQHQKGSLGDKRAVSKRVVLANVPSFRFSFRGNIRQNHPFGNHPFANPRLLFVSVSNRLNLILILPLRRGCGCNSLFNWLKIRLVCWLLKLSKHTWLCRHSRQGWRGEGWTWEWRSTFDKKKKNRTNSKWPTRGEWTWWTRGGERRRRVRIKRKRWEKGAKVFWAQGMKSLLHSLLHCYKTGFRWCKWLLGDHLAPQYLLLLLFLLFLLICIVLLSPSYHCPLSGSLSKKSTKTRFCQDKFDHDKGQKSAISGAPSPLEALHCDFCFFSSIYVQLYETSPLKSGESSEKSSGENRVKSCHVCGCHVFFGPDVGLTRKTGKNSPKTAQIAQKSVFGWFFLFLGEFLAIFPADFLAFFFGPVSGRRPDIVLLRHSLTHILGWHACKTKLRQLPRNVFSKILQSSFIRKKKAHKHKSVWPVQSPGQVARSQRFTYYPWNPRNIKMFLPGHVAGKTGDSDDRTEFYSWTEDPPPKTPTQIKTVCTNSLRKQFSGQFVQTVPIFPFKISRKQTKEFAQTVCANYFYLGGWFFWVGRLPLIYVLSFYVHCLFSALNKTHRQFRNPTPRPQQFTKFGHFVGYPRKYHPFQNHYTHEIIIFELFRGLQLQLSGVIRMN